MVNEVQSHRPLKISKWVKRIVLVLVLVLIVWFVVVPEYGGAKNGFNSLRHASILLVVVAALLEIASLLSFSALTATVIRKKRPSYFTLLRIDLTDLGVNHVVPGGGATAGVVRFHLLKKAGVPSSRALTAASIEIIVSNIMLGFVFLVGIVGSISSLAFNKLYLASGIIVLVIVVIAFVSAWLLTKHTDMIITLVLRLAKKFSDQNRIKASNFITLMANEINKIRHSPKQILYMAVFGFLNWLLDASALWIILIALGYSLNFSGLLVAYGVASILSLLPITPGGIGIVEGILVPTLVGFGVPGALALISVIGWRILEFWIPIPVSLVSYLTLRFGVLKGAG
jgi:hypothetical protein